MTDNKSFTNITKGKLKESIIPFICKGLATNRSVIKEINRMDIKPYIYSAKESKWFNHNIGSSGKLEMSIYYNILIGIYECNSIIIDKFIKKAFRFPYNFFNSKDEFELEDFILKINKKYPTSSEKNSLDNIMILIYLNINSDKEKIIHNNFYKTMCELILALEPDGEDVPKTLSDFPKDLIIYGRKVKNYLQKALGFDLKNLKELIENVDPSTIQELVSTRKLISDIKLPEIAIDSNQDITSNSNIMRVCLKEAMPICRDNGEFIKNNIRLAINYKNSAIKNDIDEYIQRDLLNKEISLFQNFIYGYNLCVYDLTDQYNLTDDDILKYICTWLYTKKLDGVELEEQFSFDNINLQSLVVHIIWSIRMQIILEDYVSCKQKCLDNFINQYLNNSLYDNKIRELEENYSQKLEKIKALEDENKKKDLEIERLMQENNKMQNQQKQIEENNYNKQELFSLREFVFLLNENKEKVECEKCTDLSVLEGKKITIVGGSTSWHKKIKELLNGYNVNFISADMLNFDKNILKHSEYVFIYCNYLSHGLYFKTINNYKNGNLKFINNRNDKIVIKEIVDFIKSKE